MGNHTAIDQVSTSVDGLKAENVLRASAGGVVGGTVLGVDAGDGGGAGLCDHDDARGLAQALIAGQQGVQDTVFQGKSPGAVVFERGPRHRHEQSVEQ